MLSVEMIVCAFLLFVGTARIVELFYLDRNKDPGRVYARWTLFPLSTGYAAVLVSAVVEFVVMQKRLVLPVSLIGLCLIIARTFVKLWAARTLGEFWSPHITIRENHALVKSGPYGYVRHPAYLSAIVDVVAVPLLVNSYYTLATLSLFLFVMILVRMKIEEQALVEEFGDAYRQYQKETCALLPLRKVKHENPTYSTPQ
jgi:protein-S-isoprenylcysteine O-methyltransferase Ste14